MGGRTYVQLHRRRNAVRLSSCRVGKTHIIFHQLGFVQYFLANSNLAPSGLGLRRESVLVCGSLFFLFFLFCSFLFCSAFHRTFLVFLGVPM